MDDLEDTRVAAPLFRRHPPALATAYADIENHALNQDEVLVGTPGALAVRRNATGTSFHVRQYYDFEGRKRDQYLGRVGDAATQARIEEWKKRVVEAREVLAAVRLLAREGFCVLDAKPLAALAPLARHGVFAAGAVLVGTHAFEVIVNRLGIRAAAFATEDVDVARPARLALPGSPKPNLLGLLRESGIDFVEVPAFRHGAPATSFKERGRSRFTFDLLVPVPGKKIETVPVPELGAHAMGLPYLRYLVAETQIGAALSPHGVAAVRVPLAERFAVHKLVVAQLRAGRPQKSGKDLQQAAVLIAALGEMRPGALEQAIGKAAASTRTHIRKSLQQLRANLEPHPRSWEEIATAVKLK